MPVSVVEKFKLESDGGRQFFIVFSIGYNLFGGGLDSQRGELTR